MQLLTLSRFSEIILATLKATANAMIQFRKWITILITAKSLGIVGVSCT